MNVVNVIANFFQSFVRIFQSCQIAVAGIPVYLYPGRIDQSDDFHQSISSFGVNAVWFNANVFLMSGCNPGHFGKRVFHRAESQFIIHPVRFDHFIGIQEIATHERGQDSCPCQTRYCSFWLH